ncbi:hypothetical protein [Wenyingzhuangia sp. IMCC45574]
MRNIMLILFCVFNTLCYGQSIDDLMKEFTNLEAFNNSEFYASYDSEKMIADDSTYIENSYADQLVIKNRIKLNNEYNKEWLNKVSSLVIKDPKILFPYLEKDEYDLAVFILLAHTYNIDLFEARETLPSINFMYSRLNDADEVNKIISKGKFKNKKEIVTFFWSPIKEISVKFVKNKIEE